MVGTALAFMPSVEGSQACRAHVWPQWTLPAKRPWEGSTWKKHLKPDLLLRVTCCSLGFSDLLITRLRSMGAAGCSAGLKNVVTYLYGLKKSGWVLNSFENLTDRPTPPTHTLKSVGVEASAPYTKRHYKQGLNPAVIEDHDRCRTGTSQDKCSPSGTH